MACKRIMIDGGKMSLSEFGLCCENVEESNGMGSPWVLSITVRFKDQSRCRHPKTVGHDFGGLRLDSQNSHGSSMPRKDSG